MLSDLERDSGNALGGERFRAFAASRRCGGGRCGFGILCARARGKLERSMMIGEAGRLNG